MDKSFIVASHDMDYIYNSFHNSTLLQMCRQMINTHLLNNGIEFCKGGCKTAKMKMDAEVEEIIDESNNSWFVPVVAIASFALGVATTVGITYAVNK